MSEKPAYQPASETEKNKERLLQELNSKKTREKIMSYIFNFKMGFSVAEIEDITQDTMLKATKSIQDSKFDASRAKLETWLTKIAKHTSIDLLRRKQRRDPFRSKDLVFSDKDEPEGPIDRIPSNEPDSREKYIIAQESAEQQKILKDSVKKLPLEQQEVWRLRNENVSFEEIAQRQGISKNTARSRHHYALERLSKLMKEYKDNY